jgi:hypothetical protein
MSDTVTLQYHFEKILEEKDKALGLYKPAFHSFKFFPIVPRFVSFECLREFFPTFFTPPIISLMTLNAQHKKAFSFSFVREVFNFSPFVLCGFVWAFWVFTGTRFTKIYIKPNVNSCITNLISFPHWVVRAAKFTSAYLTFTFVRAATNIFFKVTGSKAHYRPTAFADSFGSNYYFSSHLVLH